MFKFTQNKNLKQQLLDTDDKILVETNPADFLCSIGEELIYITPPKNPQIFSLWYVDSLVLRNPLLRQARNRYMQVLPYCSE